MDPNVGRAAMLAGSWRAGPGSCSSFAWASLDHLPEAKRAQLGATAALLQAEAPVAMVILFGSYARGDWVEDPAGPYFSDFDLLAVVGSEKIAHDETLWARMTEKCRALTGKTPVTLIAHDIREINSELRLGQYFFIDILREGVVLYDSRHFSLASPKALTPPDRLKLGLVNFRYWFASANELWRTAGYSAARGTPGGWIRSALGGAGLNFRIATS